MRIALVHELLTMKGGAERVLKCVADMFPDAPIYTLLYNEKVMGEWFPINRIRRPKYPFTYSLIPSKNHHFFLRAFPKAVESWDFSEFDLVISFSSAFAHGIKAKKHISYIHAPARYLWDRTHDVQNKIPKIIRPFASKTFHRLRQWDASVSDRGDVLFAASQEVQRRIELYWRRESEVLYPPVDVDQFPLWDGKRDDYYIIASSLVPYKRIDIAIEACKRLGKKLIIVGDGPDKKRLQRSLMCHAERRRSMVQFLGYLPHTKLLPLLQKARAFIFPGDEDFGIAPIEAMSCGTPVIAYRGGGAVETIVDGVTGKFFDEPSSDALATTIQRFEEESFDPQECHNHAQKFSRTHFTENLQKIISQN